MLAINEWEVRGTASRHVSTSGVVRVAMNLFIQWRLDRSPWSSKRVAFRSERRSAKSPVSVSLNLLDLCSGTIAYGLNWKCEMAEVGFSTLDKAIGIVAGLKKRANPVPVEWDD